MFADMDTGEGNVYLSGGGGGVLVSTAIVMLRFHSH